MTHLCVAIAVDHAADVPAALRTLAAAHAEGATMVEWRVDALAEEPDGLAAIRSLVHQSAVPAIVTIRGQREGGQYHGAETDRVSLLEAIGTGAAGGHAVPAYIDFELADLERSANVRQKVELAVQHAGQVRDVGARLMLSAHDFDGRPSALARIVAAMAAIDSCAVAKVVWRARSVRDNLEAFELLRERHKPSIALCMGEAGVMSRVLAPKFGAFLTFARAEGAGDAEAAAASALGAGTAAGQPSVRELVHTYGFSRIGPHTRVYGIVGWPVAHSKSPATHNAWFKQHGVDGVYVPIPVPPEYEHFKASMGALIDWKPLDFCGASVTLPHKQHLLQFVRERGGRVEPLAARIGAANTLVVQEDGTLACANTDAPAAVDALEEALGTVQGARVAVIGAGGVARAVAVGLASAGAAVVVVNRTHAHAVKLAEEVVAAGNSDDGVCESKSGPEPWREPGPEPRCEPHRVAGCVRADEMSALAAGGFQAFVNCTPVGMTGGPDPDGMPITDAVPLDARTVVMDTVYAPRETPLLRHARARGATAVDGWGMFMRQAARQFELWTGVRP